jgi:hypothetical protein
LDDFFFGCLGLSVILPDFNIVDLHGSIIGGWVVPSGEPCVLSVPEGVYGMWISVCPWLITMSIWEISTNSSYGNVEDQEEFLVEWSTLVGLVLPRVVEVLVEFSLGEHVFVKWEVEDFLSVNGCLDELVVPFKTVEMEIIREVSWVCVVGMCLFPGIKWISWAPM